MIAEVNGDPMGFCQYYDCWHSKGHEDWGMDIPEKGKVFSFDYLVGKPEYLRRGNGRKMIVRMLDRIQAQGADSVIALPDKGNTASNRALETCGFNWDGERYVLRLK
jgi:RimJ/RimL family protein N-acetyltransferase